MQGGLYRRSSMNLFPDRRTGGEAQQTVGRSFIVPRGSWLNNKGRGGGNRVTIPSQKAWAQKKKGLEDPALAKPFFGVKPGDSIPALATTEVFFQRLGGCVFGVLGGWTGAHLRKLDGFSLLELSGFAIFFGLLFFFLFQLARLNACRVFHRELTRVLLGWHGWDIAIDLIGLQ